MKRTPNYGLPIIENNDRYSKEEQNSTMSIIDSELHGMSETLKSIDIEGNAEIIREIVDARNNETTLKNRLDKVDSKINEVSTSLENIKNKTNNYLSACEFKLSESEIDFYKLLETAKNNGLKEVILESKTYIFNNPIKILDIHGLKIKGSGHVVGTTFKFNNTINDETFITLGVIGGQTYSSFTSFENITFLDQNSNSICFKIVGSYINGAQANWKNSFSNCQIRDFKTGVIFDTVTPDIPSTHGYSAETMFFNCKFKNNITSIITRNHQSVNNHFIGTDIENDKEDENFTFIESQCGTGIDFTGGSFIGKGKLLVLKGEIPNTYPTSTYTFKDLRFELWNGHNGVLIEEDQSFGIYSETFINFDKCFFNNFSQNIDFIRYSSRITLNIDNCKSLRGNMLIKHYPTVGRSGAYKSAGQYGQININRSCGFYIKKQKESPYGEYNTRLRNRCLIDNSFYNGNGSNQQDDEFLKVMHENAEELSMDLGYCKFKNIVFNDDNVTGGFKDVKFMLPKYGRPCKFFLYKQPVRYNNPITYELYLVKDKKYWATEIFNVETDGILISKIDTKQEAGFFESAIRLNNNDIGHILQCGEKAGSPSWTWEEGRLFAKWNNSWANGFSGFIGITYI